MKKFFLILLMMQTLSIFAQYADPYVSIMGTPPTVSINGSGELYVIAGNAGNDGMVANSLKLEIAAANNIEILGVSASHPNDTRWGITSMTSGAGNTIVFYNTGGSFGPFDVAEIYLSFRGVIAGGPYTSWVNISYLPGNNPDLGGLPNNSQGDASLVNNNSICGTIVNNALEDCSNGTDDDADGFIDCQDGDCSISGVDGSNEVIISPSFAMICGNDSVTLTPQIPNLLPSHPWIDYVWSGGIPLSDGSTIAKETNAYEITVYGLSGCIVRDTAVVTVTDIDPTVTQTNSTLTAAMPDAEYQWIDCNNAASPIAGATGQVFNPTQNGSYAVVVSKNGCNETSNCFVVNTVGTTSLEKENGVTIYPNPFADELYLTFEKEQADTQINIFGTDGKVIYTSTVSGNTATIETADFPKGLYLIQLISANKSSVFKVAK